MAESIEALGQAYEAKFDEICDLLASQHGISTDPAELFDVQQVAQIIEEAEKLVEDWDKAKTDDPSLKPKTELQHLLDEYYEIGASKKRRIRAAREDLTKRGVIIDSGEKRMNPRTGGWETVWKLNPNLTEEQQIALTEQPDIEDQH